MREPRRIRRREVLCMNKTWYNTLVVWNVKDGA
jgi:hypothetical protein